MDPTMSIMAATVFTKLFKLGSKSWDAYQSEGFDSKELAVISDAIAAGARTVTAQRPGPTVEAQHMGLVVAAFGQAFARYWRDTRTLERPGWLRRTFDAKAREDDDNIQERIRMAELVPDRMGDRMSGIAEVTAVDALTASPLKTTYYQTLWDVFSRPMPSLRSSTGDTTPLDPDGAARREFERHFLIAYGQALNSRAGTDVRGYLDTLHKDYRPRLVREILIADMATWVERHVFGNVLRSRWDDRTMPFLPLGEMYVQPRGQPVKRDKRSEPILNLLRESLEGPQGPFVTVVKADFGMGKSLTSRMLVSELAHRWLRDPGTVSTELWLPIFVRCGEDMDESGDVEAAVRSGLMRHARELGIYPRDRQDMAFALPGGDQRVLLVLDGLDEVVLGQRSLENLFRALDDLATPRFRILVLSRPGVLPDPRKLKNVAFIELLRFASRDAGGTPGGEVGEWLDRWNRVTERAGPIIAADLAGRELLDLAQTPILLFMIALIWDDMAGQPRLSRARLYEAFLQQVARGKHESDRDQHAPVHEAAVALRDNLAGAGEIAASAEPHEAMLWLLARLAWKARQRSWEQHLDRRMRGHDASDIAPLTRHEVVNVLREELRLPPDTAATVELGVVVTLQSDPTLGRDNIYFGHKSFAEFLVARYWAHCLLKLARGRERDWDKHARKLLGARLLLPEDRSFEFLMEILGEGSTAEGPPPVWTTKLRAQVRDWAEECFCRDNQEFADPEATRIQDDRRAVLREAALAIGSRIGLHDNTEAIRASSPWVYSSLVAWFWSTQEQLRIIAPRAELPGIHGCASYWEADFREANLRGANLRGADLDGADLGGADLGSADLGNADLRHANLGGAMLSGAKLHGADLDGADLRHAMLSGAKLHGADLDGADLRHADLCSADLSHATLRRADLRGADLRGADLRGADLRSAYLRHAMLSGAKLHGADLRGANHLRDADVEGAAYIDETRWPPGFDPATAGAIIED